MRRRWWVSRRWRRRTRRANKILNTRVRVWHCYTGQQKYSQYLLNMKKCMRRGYLHGQNRKKKRKKD